jgi:hypothetical protein
MVVELKDTADVVVQNKFHEWRKRNPRGRFLSLETKAKANLHGVQCHHAGTNKWYPGDPSSLTKKLKVLEDGPGSLEQWALKRGIRIHKCLIVCVMVTLSTMLIGRRAESTKRA